MPKFPTDWPQTELGDAIWLEAWYQDCGAGYDYTRKEWIEYLENLAFVVGEQDFRNLL